MTRELDWTWIDVIGTTEKRKCAKLVLKDDNDDTWTISLPPENAKFVSKALKACLKLKCMAK